jgi:hypothetical protein
MKTLLLFPPGWTLATGSPHLALPALKSFLEAHGIETHVRDLNFEAAAEINIHLSGGTARRACMGQSLEKMNEAYFAAEDRLMSLAAAFGAEWNAQTGFEYLGSPQTSSRRALEASGRTTPFDALFNSVADEVQHQQPDVVGFCLAATYQIVPVLQLCSRIRKAGFAGVIVLGGNTVSRLSQEMSIPALFDLVDGLITFQGELPLLRLCQAIEAGHSFETVPGLIWREGDNIRQNSLIENLDPNQTPPPDYRDLPVGKYWGENYLNLVAARGCYYGKCSFCAIPYGWGHGGYSGTRSVHRVYEDMLVLMDRHGINRFKFVDEALSPKFMRSLASLIVDSGLVVEWEGYTRLEPAWYDFEFVELLGRAGFRKGYFGLELLPSSGRNRLNKHDRAKPETLLETCQAGDVRAHLFCMFGYPGTGEEDAKRTVDFVLNNRDLIDTADIFPWTYAKHTSVLGAQPIFDPNCDWSLEFEHTSLGSDTLPSAQVVELASRYEEILWAEAPRLLHPTYRLFSPWKPPNIMRTRKSAPAVAEAIGTL